MQLNNHIAVLLHSLLRFTQAVTLQNAEDGFSTLQQWYDESTGLWIPSTGWWNSANCLTVIAKLAATDPSVRQRGSSIWPNTFTQAQKYNLQMQKVVEQNYLMFSYYASNGPSLPHAAAMPQAHQTNGFLNDYYDDEGWWALAWIAVYDITGDRKYLQTAQSIFDDMDKAYGTTPCGGLWWDKAHSYVNAIANELYIDVAAHLTNRASQYRSGYYLDKATTAWKWFQNSGMINAQYNINDGLDSSCKNNGGTVWSYNQGVILGALSELYRATKNADFTSTAKRIADAGISKLTDSNGILHDPCEPDCGRDGSQFKGIFARNLQILQKTSPESRYAEFLDRNADGVWQSDRNDRNEFGLEWDGPFVGPANASTQSSALDVIVGALST